MVGLMAVVVVVLVLLADDGGEKCNNHSPTPGHTPPFYRCIGWWRTHTHTHTQAHSDDCHLVLVVPLVCGCQSVHEHSRKRHRSINSPSTSSVIFRHSYPQYRSLVAGRQAD